MSVIARISQNLQKVSVHIKKFCEFKQDKYKETWWHIMNKAAEN